MELKDRILRIQKCNIKYFCDDISLRGIGYVLVDESPLHDLPLLCEYAVDHIIMKEHPCKIMLGFKRQFNIKKRLGNLTIQYIHNMIIMQKKLNPQIPSYDSGLKFKKIQQSNVVQYIALYQEIFWDVPNASFYSENHICELMSRNNYEICFLYWNNTLIGFCEYQLYKNKAIIEAIGILSEYRRKGYAKKILHNLYYVLFAENIEIIELTASTGNIAALSLYKKEGFRKCKTLSYWYEVILP